LATESSPVSEPASEPEVVDALARTVRALRRQRGWSLDKLSATAGVSKGALVAIEKASTNPNLSTLCRLSDALRVPVPTLLGQAPTTGVQIVDPAVLAPLWRGPAGGSAVLVLVTDGPAPVELWRWRLEPEEAYENVPYPVEVPKTATVLAGALELVVDGERHRVATGATATFSGAAAHTFAGAPQSGCTMLVTTHLPVGGTW
jgi:transcriptional regulator with XRE-family HTH domain